VLLVIGDPGRAKRVSEALKEHGFWALPIRPPTVPRGESSIRFSLTYHHTRDILERLLDAIFKTQHI